MNLKERVEAALRGLVTGGDVAAAVRASGVKGRTGDAKRCAVARYLQQETGLNVGWSHASYRVYEGDWDGPSACIPLASAFNAVERFSLAFDAGAFPELEEAT